MIELRCDGTTDHGGCIEDNQPCACLRQSWQAGANKCDCFSLVDSKKTWLCGCKACDSINDAGIWINTAVVTMVTDFTPTDEKPNLTPEDDKYCKCMSFTVGHFCGTCIRCKDTCKIYG